MERAGTPLMLADPRPTSPPNAGVTPARALSLAAMGTGARRRPRAASVVALAVRRFWAQDMLHHAGALTYYALLAFFNALLLGVALMGVLGTDETLNQLASFLEDNGADRNLVDSLLAAARNAVEAKTTSAAGAAVRRRGRVLALLVGLRGRLDGAQRGRRGARRPLADAPPRRGRRTHGRGGAAGGRRHDRRLPRRPRGARRARLRGPRRRGGRMPGRSSATRSRWCWP